MHYYKSNWYEVQLSFTLYLPVWVSWSRGRILYLPSKLLGLAASWWKISPQLTHHTVLQFKEIKLTLARVSTLYATYLSPGRVRGPCQGWPGCSPRSPGRPRSFLWWCCLFYWFLSSFQSISRRSQLEMSLLKSTVTRQIHPLLKT